MIEILESVARLNMRTAFRQARPLSMAFTCYLHDVQGGHMAPLMSFRGPPVTNHISGPRAFRTIPACRRTSYCSILNMSNGSKSRPGSLLFDFRSQASALECLARVLYVSLFDGRIKKGTLLVDMAIREIVSRIVDVQQQEGKLGRCQI